MCLEFKCTKCEWRKCFYTSKEVKNDNRGAPSYEVNYLSIIAMREIGSGNPSLSALCGVMNLHPPVNIKAYNDMFFFILNRKFIYKKCKYLKGNV